MSKILIVAVDFKPNPGGVAEYIDSISKHLHVIGHDVSVLAPEIEGCIEHDRLSAISVVRFPFPETAGGGGQFMACMLPVLHEIRRIKPDILIYANYKAGWVLPWLAAAVLARKRYVTVAYGLEVSNRKVGWRSRLKRWVFFHCARRVICISSYTAGKVRELGVSICRTPVVPCGVDVPALESKSRGCDVRQLLGIDDSPTLLTMGRLVERKGIDMVIMALPAVIKKIPNVVYLVAGSGPYEKRLRQLVVDMSVGDHVRFIGYIPEEEKADYYRAADVFCMPSRELDSGDFEGFGIVYLEANALGIPVVAGSVGGAVDAVAHEKSGLLVDPESEEEIADALVRLLTDPVLRKELGCKGRKRARKMFAWDGVAERFAEAIREVESGR